ncbi:MAG: mechanosensitive ion channel family protein [Actinomycetes bacterium]
MADPSAAQISEVCGSAPSWICRKVFIATGSDTWAHVIDWVVAKPLTIALIIMVAFVVNRILRSAVTRSVTRVTSQSAESSSSADFGGAPSLLSPRMRTERREARAHTLGTVLHSATSIVVWTIAVFAIFGALNINLGPLIAGAGIVGIALGFGAQSLVKDVMSGIFMLAEDQYGVGDEVDLGDAVGIIEKVSVRSTRLRDVYGVVWYVPNGQIQRVANKSQEWARALLDLTVSYDTDVVIAEQVILATATAVTEKPEWRDQVLDAPKVWGIERFGPQGIVIRLVIKTRPDKQFNLMRELRGELKGALEVAGVPLAFEQALRVQWDPGLAPPIVE